MINFFRYIGFARYTKVSVVLLTLISFLMAFHLFFIPAMEILFFDKLFVTMDVWLLIKLSLFSLFFLTSDVFLNTFYTFFATDMESRLSNQIKRDLMSRLFNSKYRFITSQSTGFFIKRVLEDAPVISRGILHLVHSVNAAIQIVTVGIIVHFLSAWLVNVYFGLIVVSVVCTLILTIPSVILNGKVGEGYSDLSELCYGMFPGILEIKTNNLMKVMLSSMSDIHQLMKRRFILYSFICSLQWQVAMFVPRIGYAIILVYGLASVERGEISIGSFLSLTVMLYIMFDPLDKLFFHYSFLHGAVMAVKRVEVILKSPQEQSGSFPYTEMGKKLQFDNVSFNHDNESILKNISMKIHAGSDIAIVGETGCGKSTLVQLILRIFDEYSGEIHLDGTELSEFELSQLRRKILYVPAAVPLFPLSIRENIDVHNSKSDQEITDVINKVNLSSLISSFPEGIHTGYREEVGDFSGGEKQRIALGRCFVQPADILILDEATSALDEENELFILNEIKREYKNRTVIRISHKLTAIEGCDRVFVLKDGTIAEEGTIEELEAANGEFCRLFNKVV